MADKFRIGRTTYAIPLVHGASATTASQSTTLNGLLMEIIVKTPTTVDSAATVTVDVLDSDSNAVYTKTGVAANTTSINLLASDLRVPLSGTQTVRVTFSAAQTVTDTVTNVTLLVDRG